MKYLDEYRNETMAQKIVGEIRRIITRPWVLMEVCGGQTHTIVKYGIDHLLPDEVELVHGPGCPVCVTSLAVSYTHLDVYKRQGLSGNEGQFI